ncbi:hypothetical protein PVAND_010082 [Polypedilum vanderplanki]|uniref:Midasin n=1 Tax=Polypedilum vanderplanki TaxID=319348 RepID=A0A9J6CEH5_POLVA|nr:hypothetical protein PVAND_010082 [Polypedilum vanderplanki]
MSVNIVNIKNSLLKVNSVFESNEISQILTKKKLIAEDIDKTIDVLCKLIIQNPHHTSLVRDNFSFLLLPIVYVLLDFSEKCYADFQIKCFILSILTENNLQIIRYSYQFFIDNKNRTPFNDNEEKGSGHKKKKMKLTSNLSDLDIVQMSLRYLKLDLSFYRRIWDWNDFIERFCNKGCDLQKFYCNQIMSMIFNMSTYQTAILNSEISEEILVNSSIEIYNETNCSNDFNEENGDFIDWKFDNDKLINVEGIYLPIYNKLTADYFNDKTDIVRVSSTKINLRSVALGISSGKAICLNGQVGCGKSMLVEYMAKRVGRIPPKIEDYQDYIETKKNIDARVTNGNIKRKVQNGSYNDIENQFSSGFLRIQLGDQTDSKVLLGQYRCTDIPGEFIWQPGILTNAVMNGYWLLLEDIDSATQDVCTILTNLLENNFLRVPGFRENLKISHGFQLFMTLRTQKNSNQSYNAAYALLEKHLYNINVLPLSRMELSEIISHNYPKLATVATRIVDVFLIFSRGGHDIDCNDTDLILGSKAKSTKEMNEVLPYANKLSSLPNSGRMVSTRDLLKLCKRSNQTFQSTSTECAYLVFQNCVDLFCSHLPAGELKTDLIISIGARLGIIESRCIHLANEFKPNFNLTSEEIIIGRAKLSVEKTLQEKKIKSNEEISENIRSKQLPPTFSFTRVSSCILERIAVAVQQSEPVLLVGETGTGKTSSVQYLAYQTNHKLVVVNMNNQSDVSDLIGGFKPVDISFIISPLRNEFEILFARTFDIIKNEKFLSHVSGCFNRGDHPILVKLMLKVISNACQISSEKKNENDLARWKILEKKLKRLDQQLKTSTNLAFAFIPGSLVNCIRNGDWVLLDEINLASTETLECLSTILEPDGSIVLLEKGDFVPIKRHPDFRIFACMNPSTDVGKKDLPVGIRNRFSEFFVDELTNESDLQTLIGDYLSNTGINKSRIREAVLLYMTLRNLSQLELNDGLGNKPVFSLRTLCRALKTCAKNLCGSIERNIYESFCLSFLTQLDSESHMKVLKKIQQHLVSDVKRVLSQSIPKPNVNVTNFEGYWVENGDKEPQECKEYILTESVQKNLKDLARIISIGKLPILLQGPTSAGKTSLIEFIAKRTGNHCLRINNHEHTDLQEYIGTYVADITGKLSFQEGVLVKAMRNGYWIILDELNLAPSDILEALNRVLDDNRELYIPETQTIVKAHPNFMLFATQNPPGLYGGRKTLSRAFKNRFIELHFSDIPKNELEIILEKRCLVPMKYAQKMVQTMTALQINRRTTTKNNFTLRDLFRWGNRYTYADNRLLEDRNYDWNQHLVDEGYLVLSAKVRNEIENEIIIETLFKKFSKKILVENLFSLSENTSMVTKNILEQLVTYKGSQNIVWTFEMRRMAVLVSKSLQFNEPVLLVGKTGCGKTSVCQLLAELRNKQLRILNCHMHTESADFLGGLRPCRESKEEFDEKQLFIWSDGPLVCSMLEGNFFLADEISLAEDSVLERLNCVLEPERSLLLAEKCETSENSNTTEFIIKASEGFQFLATMNPGGDFGKKELSPALRNRFTEIWCSANYSNEDLTKIAVNTMQLSYGCEHVIIEKIAQVIIETVSELKMKVEKLNFSIRDILAWVNYVSKNFNVNNSNSTLSLNGALFYGLHTVFLDALEMLPYENYNEINLIRTTIIDNMRQTISKVFNESIEFSDMIDIENSVVTRNSENFGIYPFFLKINESNILKSKLFSFSAPTTKRNLFRVLSALSVKKAILLEGPPGVGKSSLIENIAATIGYNLVRINLCEHTDIADLFGTDLPAENSIFESDNDLQLGSFVWRDGPLLAALKAPNTWILLDELNLAPQSVLEGLNAILDHRGEVYIPELNKTFQLGQQTRIFATQNPLRQGGGRKGLPQSFLNRFTKVYLRKLEKNDLLHVVQRNFGYLEQLESIKNYNLLEKMATFSERLENGIVNMEFGYKGGPFEANLRDMLRWCELLTNEKTGFNFEKLKNSELVIDEFLLVLFEKMKLVYCQRMRTQSDVNYIMNIFGEVFNCDPLQLQKESSTVCFFWNDSNIFFNNIQLSRILHDDKSLSLLNSDKSILLASQLENLKNLTECVLLKKPVIFCGSTDCGKTKIINTFCTIFNKELYLDTIDDSVTGSFQQFDFNRLLEELWQNLEEIIFNKLRKSILNKQINKYQLTKLFKQWRDYDLSIEYVDNTDEDRSTEIEHFCSRLDTVQNILETLRAICNEKEYDYEKMVNDVKLWQTFLRKSCKTLNTGGHFEWIDSVIVKSIKFGHFICLEHVNLVSSAILDRLNPVLEPNGSLMISERGVDENNQPENISKHPNFQMFFTMDPKYGEISRAMRNRCIELSVSHQNYSEDDLRKLIYIQGVHEMYLIKAIINIHKNLCNLSEYSNFGISQIIKMAFLVAQNKTMGVDYKKCLLMSSLEVYVRSSHLDLLGFGLDYYKNKMKECIFEVINNVVPKESFVNQRNLILHSNELTTMKMIKLQSESLLALLKANNQNIRDVLNDLNSQFDVIEISNINVTTKYLLTFLYLMSSFADIKQRKIYLSQMFSKLKSSSLIQLNEVLYETISSFSYFHHNQIDLPWNSKMFNRLRPYDEKKLKFNQELRITLSLMLELSLEDVVIKKSFNLKSIDVITYSKGIQSKILADTINNKLIKELYGLVSAFKSYAKSSIREMTVEITEETYMKLLLSFLWFNRLLEISKKQLLKHNSMTPDLLDELYLHFKWFGKHCINHISKLCENNANQHFMKTFYEVENFILSHHHSLQLYKKMFMFDYASFYPFFEETQVKLYKDLETLNNLINIIPKMNEKYEFQEYKKRLTLVMSIKYQDFRKQIYSNCNTYINDIFGNFDQLSSELKSSGLISKWIEQYQSNVLSNGFLENLTQRVTEFDDFLKMKDISINFRGTKYSVEILPILEYYIIKALPLAMASLCEINDEYILNTHSIDSNTLLLIKTLNDPRHNLLQKIVDNCNDELSKEYLKAYTSYKMTINHDIQTIIQKSFLVNNYLCRTYNNEDLYVNISNEMFVNSALLTHNMISFLIGKNGEMRETGLGEVKQWTRALNTLKNLLWLNAEINGRKYDLLENAIRYNERNANQLLDDIESVKLKCQAIENENFSDFNKDFWKVVEQLNDIMSADSSWMKNYLIESLCGTIQLNLLSYFPIIDPVKKNRFKSNYIQEDISHLNQILLSYKFMSIMLNYEQLGDENRNLLEKEIQVLREKLIKRSRKVALRPEFCVYSTMAKDVNHFLSSCCHPKQLLSIINDSKQIITLSKHKSITSSKNEANEIISKLNIWIINADKFLNHTIRNYNAYYRDFILPIECSLILLKNGFIGLKSMLYKMHDSIELIEKCELSSTMEDLIVYPISPFQQSKSNVYTLLDNVDESEEIFFKLLKSQIQQMKNTSALLVGKFDLKIFNKFDSILNFCNQLWQKQEELKRKKQIEEDSLYVTKTKCAQEDDEIVKALEISEIFPENTDNDFNEFIQQETLEQIPILNKALKKNIEIITHGDYNLIGNFFISFMNQSNINPKDYISPFEYKLKVFGSLFDRYKNGLDCSIDNFSYNSLCLLTEMCQNAFNNIQLKDSSLKNYNFYKDSNISEALTCIDVMKKLEQRVIIELEQWPDHAVLNDIIIIINRIRGFSSNSPLVRFNVGMQILRKKVDEWNSVAHRLNNFKDIETEIAEIIQKWMQMELQCWRESLNQTFDKACGKAYRYWFFLYNLIHEYLVDSNVDTDVDSSLTDYKKVEKRFTDDEIDEESPVKGKISIDAMIKVLKQFIESSSYAEFPIRMNLLKSFVIYLIWLNKSKQCAKTNQLIALLHNIYIYFEQFSFKVQEYVDFVRKPIEDKLRKFVKINSFNKDLSYFSTESNIKQVHRNLHKHLKEFEIEITKKISDLFTYKDSGTELDLNQYNINQSSQINLKYESFILLTKMENSEEVQSKEIMKNINKYILKSRNVVKESISNVKYDKLINSMNEFIADELEICNHLRSLKVDESFSRSKQKSQAKSILNQKRKALTDFFKDMTKVGINYKSGLLANTLNNEIVDLQIKPFDINKLNFSDIYTKQVVTNANQKLDLYFNKSIFKIKLLINFLLQPRSDMDFAFLERIKGFAIDLFSLVQEQRKMLGENVNSLIGLNSHLRDFNIVTSQKETLSYEFELKKYAIIKETFIHAAEILEQFKILLNCAPENGDVQNMRVIVSTNNVMHKRNNIYLKIITKTDDLITSLSQNCIKLTSYESKFFNDINEFIIVFQESIEQLEEIKELFVIDNEYSTFSSPICDLITYMSDKLTQIKSYENENKQLPSNVCNDLEKLSHMILIAMQNIYKEHRNTITEQLDEETLIEENHLKEKIHKNLMADINMLQLNEINTTLTNIFNSVFISTDNHNTELLSHIQPLVQQYKLLVDYFIIQLICAHKTSVRMLSIMLSVFIELAKNGFCIPENLLSDEEQKQEGDTKTGEGFGFEDGEGEKDVSDKIESKDQLDEAKRPEDYNKGDQEEKECKEEKGIDMSDNFEGKMHDIDENNSDSDNSDNDQNEEMDKEMGETKDDAEKLDDQIWGSDDENEKEENGEDKKDETGKGSGEKDDKHNDLNAETDGGEQQKQQQEEEGLDAASERDNKEQKKQQKKDIENFDDQGEEDEEQTNPYHNQLEEPPDAEDFNLEDEFNLDNGEKEDKEPENEENPYDIDSMKDKKDITEDPTENGDKDTEEKVNDDDAASNSSEEEENDNSENKFDNQEDDIEENTPDENKNEEESNLAKPDEVNKEENSENQEETQKELPSDYHESKDKQSKEENIQSMPNQNNKGSNDQVQVEKSEETTKQDAEIDDQDTGEDKDGIGQAENQESKSGHQGVSDARENRSQKNQDRKEEQQQRKKGNTDEERTLGDVDKMEKKFLKTVDKLNRDEKNDNNPDIDENQETDEYQHVKDAKKNDKTTLDNATEEQSRKIQHEENVHDKMTENEDESQEDLMEVDEKSEPEMVETDDMRSNKFDEKSEKPSKHEEFSKDRIEQTEEIKIDGEDVLTFSVPRGEETTAHCQMDIINDSTMCDEQSYTEALEIRKMVESEITSQKIFNPEISDMEKWQEVSNKMMTNARELCEQLRLILEPTKCTRLKGDYRTGRRINMKKIIPYIASQFRKDKIWLRRTKAAQRDYKITIAVDDSKSMDHNNSKELTLQTISLVSQALTLLESGKLSVVSFGETSKILLKYNEQFNGPNLIKSLNFDQNKTRIADLLDFTRVMNQEDSSSDSNLFEHLLIILSDGRNIFAEGEQRVRNAIKMARLQRMFLVYIIIDNPNNKNSILDVQSVQSTAEKGIKIISYMDQFPFPYYVIVRDLNQLPLVLSEGLRQWFELVNSEQ